MHLCLGVVSIEDMRVKKSQELYRQMKEGKVYRREELLPFSGALDRDLKELVKSGLVSRPAAGLYYRPSKSRWGDVPASERELVRAFLKTEDFLLSSINAYNSLPLGLTQLSNVVLVYNRKRFGRFILDGLVFDFRRPNNFPSKLNTEFLYVDLLNNLEMLPENSDELQSVLKRRLAELPREKLQKQARLYGKRSTQVKLNELLSNAR